MRQLLTFIAVLFTCTRIVASAPEKLNTRDLAVSWQVIANDQPKPGQSINQVTITNKGKVALPASGWKLYFNSARMVLPEPPSHNGKVDFLNGDLFRFNPDASFGELKPGASVQIQFVSEDPTINITDGPTGFYIVWDSEPDKGYNLGDVTTVPFKPAYPGLITTATLFDQNKNITDVPETQLTKILPTPASYKETGGYFTLDKNTTTHFDDRFAGDARKFDTWLGKVTGPGKSHKTTTHSMISLNFKGGLGAEDYELTVTADKIDINATTETGLFYGIQSLKSLLPAAAYSGKMKTVQIPCVEVKDSPRFGYRAFMLDVGRNFHPKDEIFRVIDLMAMYKLNTLHLHLTEDEGWRLQMAPLPELTDIGAHRGHSLDSKKNLPASYGSGGDVNNATGSGFYTRADYIEILRYAMANHIVVLPEIETPGHARAAVKAMNARYDRLMAEGKADEAKKYLLYSPNDPSKYSSAQNWSDNVMDVSLPSVYNFIGTVIDEIVGIYKEAGAPLTTIHFGGDEVPYGVWQQSPAFAALKATHPEIKEVNDLWYYYYGKVNEMLMARGLKLAGWEELSVRRTKLDGQPVYIPNPDWSQYHLQTEVWNNTLGGGSEDLAYKLANAGYAVVLSPVTNFYLDMSHYKAFNEPGYYWGAFVDIDKVYGFIPFDYFKNSTVDRNGLPLDQRIFIGKQRLTDYGKNYIKGLQSALWSENIRTNERLEYMITPRILGFAERAWAPDPAWATEKDLAKSTATYNDAFNAFLNQVGKRELPKLAYLDGGFNYRIPQPGVSLQDGKYVANIQFPGLVIRYTTNGKDPDAKSPIYNDAVTITSQGVKFRAFDTKGRGGNVSEPVN